MRYTFWAATVCGTIPALSLLAGCDLSTSPASDEIEFDHVRSVIKIEMEVVEDARRPTYAAFDTYRTITNTGQEAIDLPFANARELIEGDSPRLAFDVVATFPDGTEVWRGPRRFVQPAEQRGGAEDGVYRFEAGESVTISQTWYARDRIPNMEGVWLEPGTYYLHAELGPLNDPDRRLRTERTPIEFSDSVPGR